MPWQAGGQGSQGRPFLPPTQQDCLRACQEQIEALLESSLRQAQQHSSSSVPKNMEEEGDLSYTPTDVRDVNI